MTLSPHRQATSPPRPPWPLTSRHRAIGPHHHHSLNGAPACTDDFSSTDHVALAHLPLADVRAEFGVPSTTHCARPTRDERPNRRAPRYAGIASGTSGRYGSQAGSSEPAVATSQRLEWGARGGRWSRRPASPGRRSSLRALQDRQLATTFSHACGPPRDRGTTWSMFSAVRLQYWQRWPSRANTARRDSGTRLRCGTRTKCTSRITEGTGTTVRSECSSAPLRSTTSAFSFSTRTTARRI